ncbi:MAG: ABC transporter C-terminal domain-containing protein, partial [Betaproteobacteria bacterium]
TRSRAARQTNGQQGRPTVAASPTKIASTSREKTALAGKLSFKERRELDTLMASIDALELEQKSLREELADNSLYQRDPDRAITLHTRDSSIEEQLMKALERWTALSTRNDPA